MTDVATAQPPAWGITLRGRDYPLVPSVRALRAIENATGCTIFSLVEAGADGALTIDQMTAATVCMANAPDKDPLFSAAQMMLLSKAHRGLGSQADGVAGAIVEGGIMAMMPRIVLPLAAAMAGRTNAAGELANTES